MRGEAAAAQTGCRRPEREEAVRARARLGRRACANNCSVCTNTRARAPKRSAASADKMPPLECAQQLWPPPAAAKEGVQQGAMRSRAFVCVCLVVLCACARGGAYTQRARQHEATAPKCGGVKVRQTIPTVSEQQRGRDDDIFVPRCLCICIGERVHSACGKAAAQTRRAPRARLKKKRATKFLRG